MHFLTLLATAALAAANTVTFITYDNTSRILHFTPSDEHESIDSVTVAGNSEHTVSFPEGWIGNWYAVPEGTTREDSGMLGEVTFNGWQDKTYFDVSAIVDPTDKNNVKMMWPKSGKSPVSGCENFPCDNAYYHPDDTQTQVTEETDLICTLAANGEVYAADEDEE